MISSPRLCENKFKKMNPFYCPALSLFPGLDNKKLPFSIFFNKPLTAYNFFEQGVRTSRSQGYALWGRSLVFQVRRMTSQLHHVPTISQLLRFCPSAPNRCVQRAPLSNKFLRQARFAITRFALFLNTWSALLSKEKSPTMIKAVAHALTIL